MAQTAQITAKARGWANSTLIAFYFTGAGLAAAIFAAVDILPYRWRALYVIGAVPIFLVGLLRGRLPETQRFQRQRKAGIGKSAILKLVRDIARQYPMRVITVIIAAAAYGFAISPAIKANVPRLISNRADGSVPSQPNSFTTARALSDKLNAVPSLKRIPSLPPAVVSRMSPRQIGSPGLT